MPGYEPLYERDFEWVENELGVLSAKFTEAGVQMTIVKGKKGQEVPPHGHTHGSLMYVVEGRVIVDGHELVHADGGYCRPKGGIYPVQFPEDATYVVCRLAEDEITQP